MEERINSLEFDFKNLLIFLDNQTLEMREANKIVTETISRHDNTITEIFTIMKMLGDKVVELEEEIKVLKSK